jgi:hypothetical protein
MDVDDRATAVNAVADRQDVAVKHDWPSTLPKLKSRKSEKKII